jgi:plasmid stabilization system protein ParE
VAQVVLSRHLQGDFDRIFDYLFEHVPETALERVEAIIAALDVLEASPLIGRPVENGKRELVISTGASGYLALYRFVPELDTVFVLGVRSQRELGFGKAVP